MAATLSGAAAAGAGRPNILWISCEDTGPQLGCYGDPHAVTPALDRLAAQGVRYTRAYTVAGVCAPSRSGIITGMYPTTLGTHHMRCQATLPDFVRCFPEYLRRAGYYCTNNSKTDYNFPPPQSAWDESSGRAHWKNRAQGQPFFAVFNIVTTHESRLTYRGAKYDAETAALKPDQRRDPARLTLPPYYPDTPEARRDWANYYEVITAMDYQAAARLKELEDAGLLEDTIVCFWGDHGVGLPRAKRWLYEDSTHVPLIVRVPEKFRTGGQGRPGSAVSELVSFLDLAPTMLNLAGAPIPQHMQGRAFLGPNLTPPREYIFSARDRMDERYDMVRVVRDRRYRYIRNYEAHRPYAQHMATPEGGATMKELRRLKAAGKLPAAAEQFMAARKPPEELYDVEQDPHEIRNLASSPAHQQTLKRLRAVHEQWAVQTRDLGLVPEPEIAAREQAAGSRYAILRQPGAEKLIARLREAAGGANAERPLDDADAAVRYWGVVRLAGETARERLLAAMNDPAPVVRIAAARAVSNVPLLVRELKSDQEWVRLHAALALDELGGKAGPAREALRAAARDANNYVRRVAEHALSQLGG